MDLIASFFAIKLFMFICTKCKSFLFYGSQMIEFLSRDQLQIVHANPTLETLKVFLNMSEKIMLKKTKKTEKRVNIMKKTTFFFSQKYPIDYYGDIFHD